MIKETHVKYTTQRLEYSRAAQPLWDKLPEPILIPYTGIRGRWTPSHQAIPECGIRRTAKARQQLGRRSAGSTHAEQARAEMAEDDDTDWRSIYRGQQHGLGDGCRALVIGAAGNVGRVLVGALAALGSQVGALDLAFPSALRQRWQADHTVFQVDVVDRQQVQQAFAAFKPQVVFHLVAYGMSGPEQWDHHRITDVNLSGCKHVVDACIQQKVERLVFVSTYNVIFVGREIDHGSEHMAYPSVALYHDDYSRTKALAEKLVLRADRLELAGPGGKMLRPPLRTCALRAAAIYGPDEVRHLPRITRLAALGLTRVAIGEPGVRSDWLYVDNLVHAMLLAAGALHRGSACGTAYFINDNHPVNSFLFLRDLLSRAGYPEHTLFRYWLPLAPLLIVVRICDWICPRCVRRRLPYLLSRAELEKVGVTHVFSTVQAQQDLSYQPIVTWQQGLERTARKLRQDRQTASSHRTGLQADVWVAGLVVLLTALLWIVFNSQSHIPNAILKSIGSAFIISDSVLRWQLLSTPAPQLVPSGPANRHCRIPLTVVSIGASLKSVRYKRPETRAAG
eukprot:g10247.t1